MPEVPKAVGSCELGIAFLQSLGENSSTRPWAPRWPSSLRTSLPPGGHSTTLALSSLQPAPSYFEYGFPLPFSLLPALPPTDSRGALLVFLPAWRHIEGLISHLGNSLALPHTPFLVLSLKHFITPTLFPFGVTYPMTHTFINSFISS